MHSEIVKKKFNKQAQKFSNWSVTKNKQYHEAYVQFCGIHAEDTVLDVACGTGDFLVYLSPKIKKGTGVDISDGMIEVAEREREKKAINNIHFKCHPVENLPCDDQSFSLVTCKSAFHHFTQYIAILKEMKRCCLPDGRISVQDIVAYDDKYVDNYFETLEKQIDVSHHNAVSDEFIKQLYKETNIEVSQTFKLEVDLVFSEYIMHAEQSEKSIKKIESLLEQGLADEKLANYLFIKDDCIYFKRNVFLILGRKVNSSQI